MSARSSATPTAAGATLKVPTGRSLHCDPADVDALVAYLLSIDGDASVLPIPAIGAAGGDFCQQ